MNVLCDRETLRDALAVVNNVIPAKSTKPVLENVNLVATNDMLELVGTDLEVSVRYRIEDVKITDPGPALGLGTRNYIALTHIGVIGNGNCLYRQQQRLQENQQLGKCNGKKTARWS